MKSTFLIKSLLPDLPSTSHLLKPKEKVGNTSTKVNMKSTWIPSFSYENDSPLLGTVLWGHKFIILEFLKDICPVMFALNGKSYDDDDDISITGF